MLSRQEKAAMKHTDKCKILFTEKIRGRLKLMTSQGTRSRIFSTSREEAVGPHSTATNNPPK